MNGPNQTMSTEENSYTDTSEEYLSYSESEPSSDKSETKLMYNNATKHWKSWILKHRDDEMSGGMKDVYKKVKNLLQFVENNKEVDFDQVCKDIRTYMKTYKRRHLINVTNKITKGVIISRGDAEVFACSISPKNMKRVVNAYLSII